MYNTKRYSIYLCLDL